MKIFLNEYIHPLAVEKLKKRAEIVTNFDHIEDIDAIILRTQRVTEDMIIRAKKLKVIGKHGIGYDSIDIEAARENGVRVVFTPLANVNSVAELIVTLMLSTSRNITIAHKKIAKSEFQTIAPKEIIGVEVEGKILGLVGIGKISQTVASILGRGFNVKVIGYDPHISWEKSNELGIEKYENLNDMISRADYISISVPLTDDTKNLIGEKQMNCFKPTAILVNTSRGGVVDEKALLEALKAGKLRAAASDVFLREPPNRENPLVELDNFIATPHIGANTEEALYRMGMTVVEEVMAVLDGRNPKFIVV
ncbi:D-3-phosphoglycerate dehydrogenase [Anaerovirgula multivorans]|uniref:D-3-phosphoglycerate dehydrogenase n=1 Tax=Anaerovirgula multivorans TaxID=312168 RepID=A0A239L5S5_9FIRM|nr:hydroxyacid dehydrogenase [Anaerovirgula multivorans]SNT25352.1 D-3-phosphoglycerate dehydrogenase [Anaerovirgula multivorans]